MQITYAKKAKQVNVLSLKESVWREFSSMHSERCAAAGAADRAEGGVVRFEEVMGGLQDGDGCRLSDLSPHLVFICLLHLANERGLTVRSVEAHDSLLISAGGA